MRLQYGDKMKILRKTIQEKKIGRASCRERVWR